jgi:hypothetical protein
MIKNQLIGGVILIACALGAGWYGATWRAASLRLSDSSDAMKLNSSDVAAICAHVSFLGCDGLQPKERLRCVTFMPNADLCTFLGGAKRSGTDLAEVTDAVALDQRIAEIKSELANAVQRLHVTAQ